MSRNKTKTWIYIAQSISFSIFIFPSFSLPSPPQPLTPPNPGQLCPPICTGWFRHMSFGVLSMGGNSLTSHLLSVQVPGHSFPGYGFCLGDHHTQRQHRAGEATKPSSLSAIGLPARSNRPWRMLAPKRQGHEPGVLFPSDAIPPPHLLWCWFLTGRNALEMSSIYRVPGVSWRPHHWPLMCPSAGLLPSTALRSSSIQRDSLTMI